MFDFRIFDEHCNWTLIIHYTLPSIGVFIELKHNEHHLAFRYTRIYKPKNE